MNESRTDNKTPGDVRSIRLQQHELIPRPRIQSLLNKALQRAVTVLKAPSGYGKTQAVLEIERILNEQFIWFFGGRSEKTLIDFHHMLLKQISSASNEDREESALSFVQERGHVQLLQILKTLYPKGAYLVFDRLDRSPIRTEIERYIQGIIDENEQQIRVIITTTVNPNISLASLARSRQVAIITKDQLAFSKDETASFLRIRWKEERTDALIDDIVEFTDGWPQGIYALSQAFPAPPDSLEMLSESELRSSFIPDDITGSEFFVKGMDRELLLSMAFLPWFYIEDIDKILGVPGAQTRMKRMADSLPYIVSGSMNRMIMDANSRAKLINRARIEWGEIRYKEHLREIARFLVEREEWLTALRYFLEIDDVQNARNLLENRSYAWVVDRDPSEFIDIASYLNETQRAGSRGRLIRALVSELKGDFRGVLEQTEPSQGNTDENRLLGLLRNRASIAVSRDTENQTDDVNILSIIDEELAHGWWISIRYAEDILREGDYDKAESILGMVSRMIHPDSSSYAKQSHMFTQALFQYSTGKYQSALTTCGNLLKSSGNAKTFHYLRLYHLLAEIYGKTGELERSVLNGRRALSLCIDLSSEWYRTASILNLCLLDVHRGNLDQARGWLGEVETLINRFDADSGIHQEFQVTRARLAWGAGAREEALEGFEKALEFPPYSFLRMLWNRLSMAHVLLRSNDQDRAEEVITSVLQDAEKRDSTHVLTNSMLLLAFRAHLMEDEPGEQVWLKKCWSMLDIHGYRFMPASDPEIVLWAEGRRSELKTKRRTRGALIAPSRKERTEKPKEEAVQAGSSWRYIRIHTLGPMRLVTHGDIHDELWKSRLKAKRFLEILLSSETLRVSADEAGEYLWPEALPDKVRHRLHNEVSNLRKIFTKIGIEKHIEIKFEHSFYHLHLSDQVAVTHREFENLAQKGLDEFLDGMEETAYGFLKNAFDLYAGPFLKDAVYERFTDAYRQRLSELYSSILRALAEISYISSDESLSWWDRAIEHDPYDETAYKGAILTSMRSGHRGKAQRYFAALKERIVDELGLPLPEWCDQEELMNSD